MCPYYILEFRNTKSYLLQVYVGTWAKIEIVIKNHVCWIVGHCYNSFQALSLLYGLMQGRFAICSNF